MSFSFDHDLGFGSLLFVLAAVAVLVAILYRRVFVSGSDRRLWTLVALRVAALLLVLLLLYRPVISYERIESKQGQLVVLVDTSASMSVEDNPQRGTRPERMSRLAQAQQALLEHGNGLVESFDVRPFRFDAKASLLRQLSAVGTLQPTGTETHLAGSVRSAVLSGSKERTIAAIVFTDGIDNSGRNVPAALKELGVPVHTVATGYNLKDSDAGRDVMVRGVECPEQLPRNTQAKIVALIEARGLKGRVVQVELVEKDAVIAAEPLTLDDVEGVQKVELPFTPETKGRHEYTVSVSKVSDELVGQNNKHSVSTVVVDTRMRVLYVEGGIRAEYGTLVGRYLAHDPTIEYLAMVQTKPGLFIQRTNIGDWKGQGIPTDPEQLATFDVFLVGDLDSKFLGAERMAVIEKLVTEGKGLLMIGGYHSFGGGGYGGTPIGKALPVEIGKDRKQVDDPFQLKLTAAGQVHPIFSGVSGFFGGPASTEETLPTLLGCAALERLKPSAEVLAVHPERGGEHGPLTVLAVHRYGKGRAAVFAGDTTYRWYQVNRGMDAESPYIRFWGQFLRWLADKDESEALQPGLMVNTNKGFYQPGEPIVLDALLVGEDSRGVDDAAVEAVFNTEPPGGEPQTVTLERRADRAGSYTAEHIPEQPGLYSVKVVARSKNEKPYETDLQIQVGHPSREFDRLDLDEATLQAVADATGGRYVHVARVERLFEILIDERRERRILLEQRLYSPPLFWLLAIGLITGEWLLRRKYRLR